ncbi:MAG: hypothetical protein QXN59_02655, partial [Candidatus Micrarchaeaceae archaeon]
MNKFAIKFSSAPALLTAVALVFFFLPSGLAYAGLTATITPINAYVDTSATALAPFTFSGSGASSGQTLSYTITISSTQPSSGSGVCTIQQSGLSNGNQFQLNIPDGGGAVIGSNICNGGGQVTLNFQYSPYTISLEVANGTSYVDTSTNFTINPTLTFNSFSINKNSVYASNSLSFSVSWLNATGLASGSPPYTVAITDGSSSSSCSSDTTQVVSETISASDTNPVSSASLTANSPSTPGTYYYCASVTDSSYNSIETVASPQPIAVQVASPPSFSTPNYTGDADLGQQLTIGFKVNNGIGPFQVNVKYYPNGTVVGNTATVASPGGSGSLTFNTPATPNAIYTYFITGTDLGANPNYLFQSGNILIPVYPTLSAPSVTLSTYNAIEQGQTLTAALSWTGGAGPYKISVNIYNSVNGSFVQSFQQNSYIADDVNINTTSLNPGSYYLKAVVTDSSAAGPETNYSVPVAFTVIPALQATETFSPNTVTILSSPAISIEVYNGISPYSASISLVSKSNNTVIYSNTVSLTSSSNNFTYSPGKLPSGNYYANVSVTDSASPPISASLSKILTVNKLSPLLVLNAPSNFNYNGRNSTISASVSPLGITGNLIMSVNGGAGTSVGVFTTTSNTISFNAPAAAGSYSFSLDTDANAIYSAGAAAASYVISKATPTMNLFLTKTNFLYEGNTVSVPFSISITGISNNLSGFMELDGNSIGVAYQPNAIGQIINGSASVQTFGSYQLEFLTNGNDNYTSAEAVGNFIISELNASSYISVPHSFAYNGSNATITASIMPKGATGSLYMAMDGGMYKNVGSVTSASNTITFIAPAAAGNYSFKFNSTPSAQYFGVLSIGNYSIYKAPPPLSFVSACSSYPSVGPLCNTTADVSTPGNQLSASLYVNGVLDSTTYNTITYAGSNVIGLYIITFNTTGNANYSSGSISRSYDVFRIGSSGGTSSSIPTIPTTSVTTTVSTTIPTTSIATTTIPQGTVSVNQSSSSYNAGFSISNSNPFSVNFKNENAFVRIETKSNKTIKVNFTISNYTGPLPYFAYHKLFKAIDLVFRSNATIVANI